MVTRTRLTHSFSSAVLGLGLLSLLLLGSPGCGCGDDSLLPPGDEGPERCCCDFEWRPPREANGEDVVITFENEDASLDAEATPTLLPNVNFQAVSTFTVCVNEDHLIGDSVEIVFSDQATNEEYGRAALIYDQRCMPVIEALSDDLRLTSTDCGGEPLPCCCLLEWRPGPNMSGDVDIVANGVTGGLNPTITPDAFTDIGPDAIELFDVCVDPDHTLGATMVLEVRQQGSGNLMGLIQLDYDEECVPTFVPVDDDVPVLDITSTECGGDPLECCCTFEWLPPPTMMGEDVDLTAENASAGLTVDIQPGTLTSVVPRQIRQFEVCINADHNLLDQFTLVFTTAGGTELGRATIVYRVRCIADVGELTGLEDQQLTTTDCGGEPIICCCEIEWLVNDPDLVAPSPWTITLESVDGTLQPVSVDPFSIPFTTPPPTFVLFDVCVNFSHTSGAAMNLVVRDGNSVEFARLPMDWIDCVPFEGDPSGAGLWNILCQNGLVDQKPGK